MSFSSTANKKIRLTVREIVVLSVFAALMEGGKIAMAPLPNIEPVSLLIIVCACVCGLKALYPVCVFVMAEGLLYGFGIWFVSYLYIWAALVFIAAAFRKTEGRLFWGVLSGLYGLFFGALCALPYFFIGGWRGALSYWIVGIPFDLLHAAGNFAIAFALAPPCVRIFRRLYEKPPESGSP